MLDSGIAEGMMALMKGKSDAAAQAALSTEASLIVEQVVKQLDIKSGGYDTHTLKLSDAFMEYIKKLSPAQLGELADQFDSDIVFYMHTLYGEPDHSLKSFRDVMKGACHSTLLYEALRQLGDG
jgi:restriction endonuclease Mrr